MGPNPLDHFGLHDGEDTLVPLLGTSSPVRGRRLLPAGHEKLARRSAVLSGLAVPATTAFARIQKTTCGYAAKPTFPDDRLCNGLGEYGTDYANRAIVALVGLGANLAADAVYPHATTDADGQPLTGEHRYLLHSEADQLPQPAGQPDGSLDIHIQQQSPGPEQESNWLPAPAGHFNLFRR